MLMGLKFFSDLVNKEFKNSNARNLLKDFVRGKNVLCFFIFLFLSKIDLNISLFIITYYDYTSKMFYWEE